VTKCPQRFAGVLLLAAATAACGAGLGGSSPSASALSGRVVDADGEPAAGVRVEATGTNGGTAVVLTDDEGRFALNDAPAHYDLAAMPVGDRQAYVFEGLSTRTPTVTLFGARMSARSRVAALHVDDPSPTTASRIVLLAEPVDTATTRLTLVPLTGAASGDAELSWVGDAAAKVNVYALRVVVDAETEAPLGFLGIGVVRGARILAGQRTTLRMQLEPVEEDTIAGDVASPQGAAVEGIATSLRIGPRGTTAWLPGEAPATPSFALRVPSIPGMSVDVLAIGTSTDGTSSVKVGGLAPGSAGVRLELPRPPALFAPADGANDVTGATEFAWAPSAAGVHWVHFRPTSDAAPSVFVATEQSSARMPDLSALGLAIPAHTTYTWYVVDAVGARTVDEAAIRGMLATTDGPAANTRERRFQTGG
jgi:hypothetical protein